MLCRKDTLGGAQNIHPVRPRKPILQLNNMEDVNRFEEEIIDQTVYERVVSSLVRIVGGENLKKLWWECSIK